MPACPLPTAEFGLTRLSRHAMLMLYHLRTARETFASERRHRGICRVIAIFHPCLLQLSEQVGILFSLLRTRRCLWSKP